MAKNYDPVKAHEYYIRTRKLKGRKKGASAVAETLRNAGEQSVKSTNNAQLKKQRILATAQVQMLQQKLADLERALKKAMSEAAKEERESKDKANKAAKEAAKPDTAAEKAEKARDAKKYRDKNKQKLKTAAATDRANSSGGSSGGGSSTADSGGSDKSAAKDRVAELKSAIDGVKASLDKAKARRKALG